MPFIPMLENMIKLAQSQVQAESEKQYTETTKNTLHPEMGFGESRAIKNEAMARSLESAKLVEKAIGIPFYHGLIEMITSALVPLGTPLGLPKLVISKIAKMVVDMIFGKPDETLLPSLAQYVSPKIGTPPEENPYVKDPLGSLPKQSNLNMAPGKVKKGS